MLLTRVILIKQQEKSKNIVVLGKAGEQLEALQHALKQTSHEFYHAPNYQALVEYQVQAHLIIVFDSELQNEAGRKKIEESLHPV